MASVSSLDQDMRKLRLDRYTPGAANEVRRWIEETLGQKLAPGDLMEALRDGVALCQLINMAVSPGVKYKASSMPFVQMENISHFLRACEMPPLNLPSHDRFLTVDLYDGKDPAQVLQCLAAFSRRANIVNPSAFPTTIGARGNASSMSPEPTASSGGYRNTRSPQYTVNTPKIDTTPTRTFNPLNKAAYSGQISPTKSNSLSRGGLASGGQVSSWSKKDDESKTAPAWNIHQYGYMGGASQGNQGVAFGARRQITSASPQVPSLAEKEKRLKEKIEQEKRELEENERRRREQEEAEEARAREDEEARWAAETRRQRQQEEARAREDEEARLAAEERRQRQQHLAAQREEEDRLAKSEQTRREQEAEAKMEAARTRQRTISDARLNGQFLSQYQADQSQKPPVTQPVQAQPSGDAERIAELERQLAELKQQTSGRQRGDSIPQQPENARPAIPARGPSTNPPPLSNVTNQPINNAGTSHEDDWDASERDYLKKAWQDSQTIAADPMNKPPHALRSQPAKPMEQLATPTRPLPDPAAYRSSPATKPPSTGPKPPSSLLQREMERERERQREWQDNQQTTASLARDSSEGVGPGQSWNVNMYGYMGGDNQNKSGAGLGGLGSGTARRGIVGPRPMGSK